MHWLLGPAAQNPESLPLSADYGLGLANERASSEIKKKDVSTAPGFGTFFDEHVDMRDPEGAVLTERLVELYDIVRPRERKRGREVLALRIRRLAANAMRAHFFRTLSSTLYFRKADVEWYADKPSWMKHGALGDIVDALADAGLVTTITGKKMPWNSNTPSTASSYAPTDELLRLATECGVSQETIDRPIPSASLVQLFGPKSRRAYDWSNGVQPQARRGKLVHFEATPETREWTTTLEAINAFYRAQEIVLDLSADELSLWLDKRNAGAERTGAPYRMPELFKTDIYRVFNNGDEASPSFGEGGRLFGGWWMSVAQELRKAITINGQPTFELDYSACHPRMLFHERDLDGPGDIYFLPEIAAYEAATGLELDSYRPYIKWLMQVLINGRGRPDAVGKPDDIVMPPAFSVIDIVGFIEARNRPIADAFKSGAGLRLMRLESDIALEIVSQAITEGWTVLSVHDSFITTVDRRDQLRSMMIDAHVRRFGREPVIN